MRRWFDSLYTRLALVLVLALVTGFATMALLFRAHIDDSRQLGLVRGLANEIRLIDELRQRFPVADLQAIRGVQLASAPQGDTRQPTGELARLQKHLQEALGRDPDLRESTDASRRGFWVRLSDEPAESRWLFVPNPLDMLRKWSDKPKAVPGEPSRLPPAHWDGALPPGGADRADGARGAPPEPAFGARGDHPLPPPGALPPPPRGLNPFDWRWFGFWAGFAVVLLGGMLLLWQVQVPMRRLVEAMQKVGLTREPQELSVRGPREVRSVVAQFNQMVQRLRQSSEERNIMLAGIAHDLRSPLTRLRLQLELELANNPRYDAVVRNFESIDIIIDQFLLFARGGEAEALEERDLILFLQEVAADYLDRGLVVEIPDDLALTLAIRPGALRRAIHNLIDNAFEYGTTPVRLRACREDAWLQIEVIDAGAGIADDQREAARQPFARLDSARSGQAHCGLGLAIVDAVVAGLGGRFELESAQPQGLLARISLPLTRH